MTKAVERVWNRCEKRIQYTIIFKLAKSFRIQSLTMDDYVSEAMHLFFINFYEKYENDNQYLRFMFIVIKNKMCDLYNREKRYYKTHKTSESLLAGIFLIPDLMSNGIVKKHAINEVPESESIMKYVATNGSEVTDSIVHAETCKEIERKLVTEESRQVFRLMKDGYRRCEIGEELGMEPNKVANIKKKKIWPVVKSVMNISDDRYKWLTCSGRIYS